MILEKDKKRKSIKKKCLFSLNNLMKWDLTFRREYRKLYYKIIIKKMYDISDYNRFIEMSGENYHKLHKISLLDIEKPKIFNIEHKKVIIDFD